MIPLISFGRSRDRLKTGFKQIGPLMCIYFFTDLLCKHEVALSRKMAAKGFSLLCFNEAFQKALRTLENCTIGSLTPYLSKALYSVLSG